jgi:hypothetical protein
MMFTPIHVAGHIPKPQQRAETDFFSGEPLRALSTLVYSDNVDLQRSASLTFAEITERGTLCMNHVTGRFGTNIPKQM